MFFKGAVRSAGRPASSRGGAPEQFKDPPFFRSYNRIMGLAYAGLLLALLAFFAWQLRQSSRQEVAFIQQQLERHAQFLEFVLRSSSDQVDALRMAAGHSAADEDTSPHRCSPGPQLRQEGRLRERAHGWDRDTMVDRDAGGNLVGRGSLAGRPESFYCDLQSVLRLDNQLRAMGFHLPNAAGVRFVSTQGFHLVAPWRPAREMPFDRSLYEDPVWQMGLPQANPDRVKYWGPAYFGGQDVGLLVPVAAPVYDRDRFMGVLGLDVSVDYLNRVNGNFGYPLGMVSIVDAEGRVLANPGLYADALAVQAPARLKQVFSPEVLGSVEELLALPDRQAVARGGWLVVRHGFVAAPWQLVYTVPRGELWGLLLARHGPSMLAVLVGLTVLVALSYWLTSREFVRPAARLVSHIVAESNLRTMPTPKVPPAWRPSFDAITRAFKQSVELTNLRKEVDIAASLQQAILPRQWPRDERFALWGTTAAARVVGGDFFDHFEAASGRRALVVADVSGKGIAAGLFAMVSKTLLRSVATQRQVPAGEIAAHVNNGLCPDNETSMFVTTLYAEYAPDTGEVVYVNAGHPPPLVVRADGRCEWLGTTGGTAFGVMEDLPYGESRVQLAPGDLLLLYTDGVTEAEYIEGGQFGMQRLEELFAGRPAPAPRQAIDRVLQAVERFAGGAIQFDDITCMALQCHRTGEGA